MAILPKFHCFHEKTKFLLHIYTVLPRIPENQLTHGCLIYFYGHLTMCSMHVIFFFAPTFSQFSQVYAWLNPVFCIIFSEESKQIKNISVSVPFHPLVGASRACLAPVGVETPIRPVSLLFDSAHLYLEQELT